MQPPKASSSIAVSGGNVDVDVDRLFEDQMRDVEQEVVDVGFILD